ncbi:hypothetical protein AGMMS49587_19530 [Spirochaetia bacterium]|nr:hypothetical protein AGMMS49587_19530 [Spirochaetia bacterium]
MTVTKVTPAKNSNRLTEEDKAILKPLYALRAKREKEMEGMTSKERVAYIHNFELEAQEMAGFHKKHPELTAK